jgi:hypothetical protein
MARMTFEFDSKTLSKKACNTYYKHDTTTCYRIIGEQGVFSTKLTTIRYKAGNEDAKSEITIPNNQVDLEVERQEKLYNLDRIG